MAGGLLMFGAGLAYMASGMLNMFSGDDHDYFLWYGGILMTSGYAALEVSRRLARPCPGEIIDDAIATPKGNVSFMAVVGIDRGALHPKDIAIYGIGIQTGLLKDTLQLRSQAASVAAAWGFRELRISAERGLQSTSANPGQGLELRVELKRYNTVINLIRMTVMGR
jgi:hypothetical protein